MWGWLAMVAVGFALGFFGGGGGILTVPVLTYLFLVPAESATGYSLWVVGATSLVGAIRGASQKHVDLKAGLVLLLPSMIAAFSVRRWVIPMIPNEIARIGDVSISKNAALMLLFSAIMLLVAARMLKRSAPAETEPTLAPPGTMLLIGAAVGVLAGLVGAGGGFLIVPALVVYGGLNMKQAVGTSLMVIAVQSLVGFSGEAMVKPILWPWAFMLAMVAVVGLAFGIFLGSRVRAEDIKKGFGWFVLLMGIFVMIRELIGLFSAR